MCAEIQSDSPSPAGRSVGRLGSSALGGITGIVWGRGRAEGWREGETTDGAEADSITASSAPVLPAANPNTSRRYSTCPPSVKRPRPLR